MSVITLQFGQCGNQIGRKLFSLLSGEDSTAVEYENCQKWFRKKDNKLVARSILIDTEHKVIEEICEDQTRRNALFEYDKSNIIVQKSGGAGNNWAFGYTEKGPQMQELIIERVRKEAEMSDEVLCLLSLSSSAGGTGSGVGSYMMQCLQDEYPSKTLLSAVVLPFNEGDVIVQNYNTILTLDKLTEHSDMVFVFQNDNLHQICTNIMKHKEAKFADLNSVVGLKLASVFQAIDSSGSCSIYEFVSHLSSHPGYKLLSVRSTPHISKEVKHYETHIQWKGLVEQLKRTLRTGMGDGQPLYDWETVSPRLVTSSKHSAINYSVSISNALISYGSCGNDELLDMILPLREDALYPTWVPRCSRIAHFHKNNKLLARDQFMSLVTNNSFISGPLSAIVGKAWNSFMHKAYLHHYSKFGIDDEHLFECFGRAENTIKLYKSLNQMN